MQDGLPCPSSRYFRPVASAIAGQRSHRSYPHGAAPFRTAWGPCRQPFHARTSGQRQPSCWPLGKLRWCPLSSPFLLGFILGGLSGALWADSQLPEACLGREVLLEGVIETLPRVQRIAPDRWRVSAELAVTEIGDSACRGPRSVLVSQYLEAEALPQAFRYRHHVSGMWRLRSLPSS